MSESLFPETQLKVVMVVFNLVTLDLAGKTKGGDLVSTGIVEVMVACRALR